MTNMTSLRVFKNDRFISIGEEQKIVDTPAVWAYWNSTEGDMHKNRKKDI
jgi:hypothetical protein